MQNFGEAAVRMCFAAAGVLEWRPWEFWRATPAELAACLGEACASDPILDADTIAELQRRFPD